MLQEKGIYRRQDATWASFILKYTILYLLVEIKALAPGLMKSRCLRFEQELLQAMDLFGSYPCSGHAFRHHILVFDKKIFYLGCREVVLQIKNFLALHLTDVSILLGILNTFLLSFLQKSKCVSFFLLCILLMIILFDNLLFFLKFNSIIPVV